MEDKLLPTVDIPEKDQARFVLPCPLQLLIENATKHNAVGSEKPLVSSIWTSPARRSGLKRQKKNMQ